MSEITCKKCNNLYSLNNFYKDKKFKNGHRSTCKNCDIDKAKKWNKENSSAHAEHQRVFVKRKPDKAKEQKQKYVLNNKEKVNESYNKTFLKYKEKYLEKFRKTDKLRRETDPIYKMRRSVSNRICSAIKNAGFNKNSKTLSMLCCDWETLKFHLESKFQEGMTWENHGKWHVDHIIPCASAKTIEQLVALQHYANLQPLWAKDNIAKSDKMPVSIEEIKRIINEQVD
jgi:hypothetical protein